MSTASPSGSLLQPLGTADGVEFAIGRTSEPWKLPIDMLTISAGPAGRMGALGGTLMSVMPELDWDGIDYGSLAPDAPTALSVSDLYGRRTRTQLRSLAVASVREPGAGLGSEGPATVEAAARAAASVIRMADADGVGALGLPLLGSEAAGLPVEEVAEAVVAGARETVGAGDVASLRSVVFVCRDGLAERAIRLAWRLSEPVGEPAGGVRMPVHHTGETLLGLTFAVMQARNVSRATPLDVLLAALLIGTRWSAEDSSTAVLLRVLPGDSDRRMDRALAAARVVNLDLDTAPEGGADRAELADVVTAGERIARLVESSEVLPHHIAAAAMGMMPEAEIPRPVLTALGVSQRQLRDALRNAIAQRWQHEPTEAWAEVWAAGETAPASTVHRYADMLSDAESAEDQLGVSADVNAMAALLAATTTSPPLSVALLGNWGSGKSTFMNLVRQRVAKLREHAAADPTSPYSPTIRQIRFNAWHYSDDQVWVGLVEHLFQALREDAPVRSEQGSSVPELEAQLEAAQIRRARLAGELERIDELEPDRGWWGWLWQPRRLALIVRAARRQASHGVTWKAILSAASWAAIAAVVFIVGTLWGSSAVKWIAALPVLAALVTPAVSVWRRASEIADAAHKRLVEDKTQLAEDIAALEAELGRADPVRGLKAVVDELNSGDRYKPFRGLTGQIHQDLGRLDEQMSKLDERTRPRIILYVDDLDRCTSDRVVHVLQAVNLLLSMSLFVVVVAVDPRWLLEALEQHYGKPLDGRVRALDYLDKIFHVPFAIRPMDHQAGEYLRSLLPDVEPDADPAQTGPPAPVDASRPVPERVEPPEPERRDAPTSSGGEPGDEAAAGDGLTGQQLHIRPQEADFLPRVASILDTPRAVKRAVNLYALLRAGIPDAELDEFLGDDDGGHFQAAALLIAGIVSRPAEASDLLECVLRAGDDDPMVQVLRSGQPPVCARLADLIDRFAGEFSLLGKASTYQPWARTVARYGFESYALFGDAPVAGRVTAAGSSSSGAGLSAAVTREPRAHA